MTTLEQPVLESKEHKARGGWRLASILLLLAVAVLAATQLAPRTLGGRNTYTITNGVSMLPTIQPRSVVITRQEPSYRVGQIAAYYNPDIHAVVLHRIVARDGTKYVFKGDNNQFPDIYEPTKLVGKEIFYSSSAGRVLLSLRSPILGAALFGVIALWIMWPSKRSSASRAA